MFVYQRVVKVQGSPNRKRSFFPKKRWGFTVSPHGGLSVVPGVEGLFKQRNGDFFCMDVLIFCARRRQHLRTLSSKVVFVVVFVFTNSIGISWPAKSVGLPTENDDLFNHAKSGFHDQTWNLHQQINFYKVVWPSNLGATKKDDILRWRKPSFGGWFHPELQVVFQVVESSWLWFFS